VTDVEDIDSSRLALKRGVGHSNRVLTLPTAIDSRYETMVNVIVILVSALMLALLLVWWRWPAFRPWIELPKYSMLRQERRFDDQLK
jgi:hypothetical protein